jgi:hypothetical protein
MSGVGKERPALKRRGTGDRSEEVREGVVWGKSEVESTAAAGEYQLAIP